MSITAWLDRAITRIRMLTGEPGINAKYSDDNLIDLIETSYGTVIADELIRQSAAPLVASMTLNLAAGTEYYVLPPTIQEVLWVGERDANTHNMMSDFKPRARLNPAGPGWIMEGNLMRWVPVPSVAKTLAVDYIPSADVRLHYGTAGTVGATSVVLAASPTKGALDERPNAYAGSILRILSSSGATAAVGEERVISAYNSATRTATVPLAWATTPSGTVTYEIAPLVSQIGDMIVSYYVAKLLVGLEGNRVRQATMEMAYREQMRNLRLRISKLEMRRGTRFQHDTIDNPGYVATTWTATIAS